MCALIHMCFVVLLYSHIVLACSFHFKMYNIRETTHNSFVCNESSLNKCIHTYMYICIDRVHSFMYTHAEAEEYNLASLMMPTKSLLKDALVMRMRCTHTHIYICMYNVRSSFSSSSLFFS